MNNAIAFAERLMSLLDQGSFTATYKYSVLLGLMDLAMEQLGKNTEDSLVLTTHQLALKVTELYWTHSSPYQAGGGNMDVLRQNNGKQAKIISLIQKARSDTAVGSLAPYFRLKTMDEERFNTLVKEVEWVLIEMPLPKLQRVGNSVVPFIYKINWDDNVKEGSVRAYQKGRSTEFDNRIYLKPRVAQYLIELNGLLRPVIQRQWVLQVAALNSIEESNLHNFLFGQKRIDLTGLTSDLLDVQNHSCFYCGEKIGITQNMRPEVDHFIPWARMASNDLFNLVVAHRVCNGKKKDFLSSSDHLTNWWKRLNTASTIHSDLKTIAQDKSWIANHEGVESIVHSTYSRLMPGAELWIEGKRFESADLHQIQNILHS